MKRLYRLLFRLRAVACLGGALSLAALSAAAGTSLQVLLPGEASAAGTADDPAVTQTRLVKAAEVQRQAVSVVRPDDQLVFPFFPDATYTVAVTRVSTGYGGATVVEGVVEGVADARFLSVSASDGTRYELRDPGRRFLYTILSQPDGALTVREYDDTKRPPVHDLPPVDPPRKPASSAERASAPVVEPLATTVTEIDLMLVFDTNAQTWAAANGGLTTVANAAVSKMNLALANSGVEAAFRLVHIWASGHTYSGSLYTDLLALGGGTGNLSDAPALRNTHGADVVSLLVDTGSAYGSVGIAYMLGSAAGDATAAFSVCAVRSVNISHTLTHEIGHNLGCGHSKYQASDTGPSPLYTYAAGWYFTGSNALKYNTVMAYDSDGYGNSYIECDYFSTPLKTYQGVAVGHATNGDNARAIGNVKGFVAAYRAAVAAGTATPQFTPPSGTIFSTSLEVTLACATPGATIRYTTDSLEPTETSTLYTAPIILSDTTTVKAKAFASELASSATATAVFTKLVTVPLAPTGLTAASGTSTEYVPLTWIAASGATAYEVRRHTWNFSALAVKIGETEATSYSDSSATPGVVYYYWVRSRNTAGTSGLSGSASGYRALAAPAGVAATDTDSARLRVTWSVAAGAYRYRVSRATSAAGAKSDVGSWQTGTTYDDAAAVVGITYYYWVRAAVNSAGARASAYSVAESGRRPPIPANNDFASAILLSGTSGQALGDSRGATKQTAEPDHYGYADATASVWWAWTAPAATQVVFDTVGSSFDTVLAVYTGTSVSVLTPVASNDDASGTASRVTFDTVAGAVYRIAVAGTGGSSGDVVLNWAFVTPEKPVILAVQIVMLTGLPVFRIQFHAVSGKTYTVERATLLNATTQWQGLSPAVTTYATVDGLQTLDVAMPPDAPTGFFRIVEE